LIYSLHDLQHDKLIPFREKFIDDFFVSPNTLLKRICCLTL
jgi:hypothetical protein